MKPRNFPQRKNLRRQNAKATSAVYGAKHEALRAVRTKKVRADRGRFER